jgi:hypothetical protein
VAVELVVQDAIAGLGRRRLAGDEVVERALGIEHHDGERASNGDARLGETRRVDPLHFGRHFGQAQALGEAAGRIDREAQRPLARGSGCEPERRRGRRFAHSAGADAQDDPPRFDEGSEGHEPSSTAADRTGKRKFGPEPRV